MNISGIRASSVFYDYNLIKNHESGNHQAEATKAPEISVGESAGQEQTSAVSVSKPDRGAEEYAQRYQPDTTYELKGIDSDINGLDMEKVLSELKKDEVLQQYQFFVGESQPKNGIPDNRMNENFSL